MQVAVITSTSGLDDEPDLQQFKLWDKFEYSQYCEIKKELISYVVDKSDFKQGKFLPGSHIPVKNEETIKLDKPDFIVILPWNLKDEIISQLSYIKEWDAKFVVAIPEIEIL